MSPCSPSSITEFQEGLWHPRRFGGQASPWFPISASRLPASEGFLRTLIGCLYLRCVKRDARERRRGVAGAGTRGVGSSAFPSPGAPLLPHTCFGDLPWRRAGKHSRADGWSLSRHPEYIAVILQGPPKQGLAMAKTNTILQQPWMHFRNAKAIHQPSP